MDNESEDRRMQSVYSKRIKAGKRRTYFFDVMPTRSNDYYITITESRKRFNDDGYDRHTIFLYKEDANKFLKGLTDAIDYVKTELMPDFDFDAYNHEEEPAEADKSPYIELPTPDKPMVEVMIYIPDSDVSLMDSEAITNRCGDFLETLGFELETEDNPIYSSFFKRMNFIFPKRVPERTVDNLMKMGKGALNGEYVKMPTPEDTEKLANAAEKLVASLDKFDEGVVRLGVLLVLKKRVNGDPQIFILELNQTLIELLREKPQLMKSLTTLYELVTGDTGPGRQRDGESPEPATVGLPD